MSTPDLSYASALTLIGAGMFPFGGVAVGAVHAAYERDTEPMMRPTRNVVRDFLDISI